MKPNETSQGKLTSLNEIISPDSQAEVNQVSYNNVTSTRYCNNQNPNQSGNNTSTYVRGQTTTSGPQIKITRKIVTSQPVTQTTVTRKIVTTTSTKAGEPSQNNRYNNSNSNTNITSTRTMGSNYSRPGTQPTSNYSRTGTQNNNINISRVNNTNTNNNNQNYRNYQKPEQPQRIQNSQSYSGNRNQPKRVEVSSSHYKLQAQSPAPGTIKRKTIIRGKPVENIQITHIIYSSRPLEFHITEELNLDNLKTKPIQISEEERNKLQKSGKVEVSYCCGDKKEQKSVNLDGTLVHYQHAQGKGMTDDNSKNLNKKFYQSQIIPLEPLVFNKGEPSVEYLEFRSAGKNYNTANNTKPKIAPKTIVKPTTTYNTNQGNKTYTQTRTYANTSQAKNTGNRGGVSNTTVKTTGTNLRGSSGTGQIVKETTTKVSMGSRSQYQNQSKPTVSTTTERKVYNQNNFFKK